MQPGRAAPKLTEARVSPAPSSGQTAPRSDPASGSSRPAPTRSHPRETARSRETPRTHSPDGPRGHHGDVVACGRLCRLRCHPFRHCRSKVHRISSPAPRRAPGRLWPAHRQSSNSASRRRAPTVVGTPVGDPLPDRESVDHSPMAGAGGAVRGDVAVQVRDPVVEPPLVRMTTASGRGVVLAGHGVTACSSWRRVVPSTASPGTRFRCGGSAPPTIGLCGSRRDGWRPRCR